jgi:hypothetical protein
MQEPAFGYHVVLEVCPASTLERLGLKQSYKHADLAQVRVQILHELTRRTGVSCPDHVECQVAEDRDGDALDSVIAAIATYRALEQRDNSPSISETSLLEGFVYV